MIENTEKIIEKIFKIGITKINKMNTEDVSLLKDIITIEKGTMVNPTNYLNYDNVNTIRYIRVADLLNVGETFVDKHNKDLKISKFDDILCAFDGAPGRNNVGIFGAYSSSVYNLKCKNENKGIVYFEINCDLNQKIIKEYTHATTIAHASKSIQYLKHFNLDLETREHFNYLFNTIVLCKIKIENLKKIKSFLLNKYF